MANRKKRPATNPERDRVKEIFRQNIQIAKKLQHKGYRDTLAMYDLSEKYCAGMMKRRKSCEKTGSSPHRPACSAQ